MPDEWINLLKQFKEKNKIFLDFMFNTGCRFDEGNNIRPIDFDFTRNTVRLWKTKTKAKKGETHGKPRTISLSNAFSRRIKKYSSQFKPDEFIFRENIISLNRLIKLKLKLNGVKDYYNFSTHNIRKTHGMYLKALGIDMAEICQRLGHDYNTYIKHYGSADIFGDKDFILIRELLDDLYSRQRRF
jgi:integrase